MVLFAWHHKAQDLIAMEKRQQRRNRDEGCIRTMRCATRATGRLNVSSYPAFFLINGGQHAAASVSEFNVKKEHRKVE